MGTMRNLELVVSSGPDGSYRVAARSEVGDTPETSTRLPFDDRELGRQLQALQLALIGPEPMPGKARPADEQPAREFGRQLFEFLFPARVREHWRTFCGQVAHDDAPIQLRLRIRPPELAALPWEFLYDPDRDEYLALNTSLVRYPEVLEPVRPLAVTAPLRILAMVSRPSQLDSLNVEQEKLRLTEAVAGMQDAGLLQLSWVPGQTWQDLRHALDQDRWNIFHFIGHGAFDAVSGKGFLALADEDGGVHRLAASDLKLLLGGHRSSLRLAVLNACDGARASTSDLFSSTAAALTRSGVPAVVAMQYEISDQAAIAFARGLYGAVASRLPVDQAVTRGRQEIKLTFRNTLEWATPVLHLHSADADLFDLRPAAPTAEPTVAPADSARQAETPSPPGPTIPTQRRVGSLLVQMAHADKVTAVAFNQHGTLLATASNDNTARLWDTASSHELTRMTHDGAVHALAFSPDGTRLATASNDNTARLWDTETGHELTRMTHDGAVHALAFNLDGTHLATASWDSTARLWDTETGHELTRMQHNDLVWSVAFNPDGSRLATASNDKTARLWDTDTGQEVGRWTFGLAVRSAVLRPDGARLGTASWDSARLWDTVSYRELTRMPHGAMVGAVAFSPDGARLATVAFKITRLWDSATGRELARMSHGDRIAAMALSPNGTRLATASNDKTARLWAI